MKLYEILPTKMKSIYALFLFFALTLIRSAVSDNSSDILPAIPLVVKNPYLNTWLLSPQLPGVWPSFWNGANRGITAMVRVKGQTYQLMGRPDADLNSTQLTDGNVHFIECTYNRILNVLN